MMRLSIFVLLALSVILSMASTAPVNAHGLRGGVVSSSANYAQDQPAGKLSVDINVNKGGGGGKWYANPLWVAVGGLGLLVVILLIVMAARGGGTTVVK